MDVEILHKALLTHLQPQRIALSVSLALPLPLALSSPAPPCRNHQLFLVFVGFRMPQTAKLIQSSGSEHTFQSTLSRILYS